MNIGILLLSEINNAGQLPDVSMLHMYYYDYINQLSLYWFINE